MNGLTIERAKLIELDDELKNPRPGGKVTPVQFNPESLKLTYSNQVQSQPNSAGTPPPSGTAGRGAANQAQPNRQFVGQGTTKLALQLWFDVSAATAAPFMVDDVRRLTAEVLYFMKPRDLGGASNASQCVPPAVRFSWASFLFDGVVESLEETIEFFSHQGKPLRASIALGLVQQNILLATFLGDGRVSRPPGTRPLSSAQSGKPLQQMAGPGSGPGPAPARRDGQGALKTPGSWQQVALANGIENPRALPTGGLIDLAAQRPRIVTE